MREILRRVAIAAWWIGALTLGLGVLGMIVAKANGGADAEAIPMFALPITLPCWVISYVLGGSFWKPPKP